MRRKTMTDANMRLDFCSASLAIVVLLFAHSGCSDIRNETAVELLRGPDWVDSLVWENPSVRKYIDDTLRTNYRYQNLTFHNLNFTGSERIRRESSDVFPQRVLPSWQPDALYWTLSPDSTLAASAGGFGEIDSDLLLFNRGKLRHIDRLESCGSGCAFLGVRWIDENRFVFPQIERFERTVATVKVFDLELDSIYVYKSDSI